MGRASPGSGEDTTLGTDGSGSGRPTIVGPYRVEREIGRGGMGVVYLAHDERLRRPVAIKVLPRELAANADAIDRFKQEARAAGLLNHPNLLTVYDVGELAGAPYLVTELLEGETLRGHLRLGRLALRRVIDYALQVLGGLAAAHEKGIVHRDLKPENLFVTKEGRVKILDFGLAKLMHPQPTRDGSDRTTEFGTEPGTRLGTVGYMSPEQVRGEPVDHRSDLFSFGVVLYEMLAGERAFQRDSAVETMSAILKEEPPDLSHLSPAVPPALERMVRHFLAKDPASRFQSARDAVFHLEALSTASAGSLATVPTVRPALRSRLLATALGTSLLAAAIWASFALGEKAARPVPLSFERLTYRRGTVYSARFAPDGQTIVYSAAWEGLPIEILSGRIGSAEGRPLDLPDADLLSVSRSGEMAILAGGVTSSFEEFTVGTLAQAPLAGGAARELLESVAYADWSPDGKELAVVHWVEGKARLEFPIGSVLAETSGEFLNPRVSPRGDRVAFIERPIYGSLGGTIAVAGRGGEKRSLASVTFANGLAWSPDGSEVWFTGLLSGGETWFGGPLPAEPALHAVTLSGRTRLLAKLLARLRLHDVAGDGRALLASEVLQGAVVGRGPDQEAESVLSRFDSSQSCDLSSDGRSVLLEENRAAYLRPMDGSTAVRLWEGAALALSPGGESLLGWKTGPERELFLIPTGPGKPRRIGLGRIIPSYADWFPDGKRILVSGGEPGQDVRCYVVDLGGGEPSPVTSGDFELHPTTHPIAPDGESFVAFRSDGSHWVHSLAGGDPSPLAGLEPGELPIRWSADGSALFVYSPFGVPARVYRLELATGLRPLWREIRPPDVAGVSRVRYVQIGQDERSYAYGYMRLLSDLYVVDGLR